MPGLLSLSKSLLSTIGERRAQCALLELDDNDKPVDEYIAFQYFPETISDVKAVHYASRDILGGSLPLYQWTSSGERVISFQAFFTSDVDLLQDPSLVTKIKQAGQLRRNIDPRTAVVWLRRFMFPRYGKVDDLGVPITTPPHKCILRIQNSGLGIAGGESNDIPPAEGEQQQGVAGTQRDSMIAIMTQCDVTWEAYFTSGLPRIVAIQLAFTQVAQLGGQVNFPTFTKTGGDTWVKSGSDSARLFPYPLRVQFK